MVLTTLGGVSTVRERGTQAGSNAGRIVVVLDDELGGLRAHLQDALGPAFSVADSSALPHAVAAVVGPQVDRIEHLRATHPSLLIVVYGGAEADTVTYLEARADDHARNCSMRVLAARLHAGVRRQAWQALEA